VNPEEEALEKRPHPAGLDGSAKTRPICYFGEIEEGKTRGGRKSGRDFQGSDREQAMTR